MDEYTSDASSAMRTIFTTERRDRAFASSDLPASLGAFAYLHEELINKFSFADGPKVHEYDTMLSIAYSHSNHASQLR